MSRPINSHFRYVILVVGFFSLIVIFSNYIIINFTFICMKEDHTYSWTDDNGTLHNPLDYTPDEKKILIWAVALGTILGTLPINWLYLQYGAKWPFLSAGLLSIVSTVFVPSAAVHTYNGLLLLRFIQGLAYSADFAVIGIICVKWAPLDESATFIAILTSFSSFAGVITNAASGFLCESSLGWQSSYYIHSICGLVCFFFWIFLYTDHPSDHKMVSNTELERIQFEKPDENTTKRNIPWKGLLTNKAILCVWGNSFLEMTSTILLLTYSPIYFNRVLEFNIEATGYFVGISIALQIPFKFTAAFVSDKLRIVGPMKKMLFFNTISVGLAGAMFIIAGLIPASHKWISLAAFTSIHCFQSTNCGGFYKCATLVARQYADVVIATIQFFKCIALFVGPALIAATVKDEENQQQWQIAFSITGVALILANFSSYFLFSTEAAPFTHVQTINMKDTEEKNFADSGKL